MNRAAYTAVRESFRLGMTEKDVEQLILDAYRRVAGDSFTFCGDIVGGKRSADIEGGATDYVLQTGDALILDLQPQIDGVFCDTTRTFFVGEPGDAVRAVYGAVKNTLLRLEKQLHSGVQACTLYTEMQNSLKEYGCSCPHHAGHGIGRNREIRPEFLPEVSETVIAGEVVALEPGVYQEDGFGIRLENNYLITLHGGQPLFDYSLDIDDFVLGG